MSIEDERIESLKKKLFSNSGVNEVIDPKRSRLQKHSVLVNSSWDDEAENENPVTSPHHTDTDRGPFIKKVLLGVFVLFLLASAFAAYTFITGTNYISNSNINILLLGPVTTPAGEELSLDVDITNNNSSDLLLADLVITYPEGTRSATDHITPMVTDRIAVGTIPKGKRVRETIKSVLFGEENVKKNIKISLEYRINGSVSIFDKEKDFPIFIGSSPITVAIDTVKEVSPEEETEFEATLKSNSSSIIKGLVFKVDYPFGFEFLSAVPATSGDNATWVLGDIQPGEERKISFKGKMTGSDNQERNFRFYTGTEDSEEKTNIGTIFVTNTVAVSIKKPFLAADISIDDKSNSVVSARAGNSIKGEITWQNNLDVPLNDVVIEARVTGPMLDKQTVNGERGFYRSIDNTIVWDKSSLSDLKEIDPRGSGRVQFNFAALPPSLVTNSTFRRQDLKVALSIHAKRLSEGSVPEEISSNLTRTIKIASDLVLKNKLVRTVGPFENTGPMPTMPEQASTYTVLVTVNNSYNNVKDVVYKATLPRYVEWLGKVYPPNARVQYSPDRREITWTVGDVAPGVGYNSSAKEFAYQVSFLPSISQKGESPEIIGASSLMGKDDFTGGIDQVIASPLDIKIESDPAYKYGDEKVGGQ
jgi:hypothetical protein